MLARLIQRIGEVGIREEREVVLLHARLTTIGVGIFTTQTHHGTPTAIVHCRYGVCRTDILGIGDVVIIHYRWYPLFAEQVAVCCGAINLVVGIFSTILQHPICRQTTLTSHLRRSDAELRVAAVVIERINGLATLRNRSAAIVKRCGCALVVIGNKFER